MLTYTNHLKRLVLPEYGRNIQKMVDHCLTIEDRGERTACAHRIVAAMQTLFPNQGNADEYRRKLWDHLVIMSNFELDVDFPYEHVQAKTFDGGPDPVPAERPGSIPYHHYGHFIPRLICAAVDLEPGEERDALIFMIANQMKKTLLATNPEGVEDARVFSDLRNMSHGAINISPAEMRLNEFIQPVVPSGKKKKKK